MRTFFYFSTIALLATSVHAQSLHDIYQEALRFDAGYQSESTAAPINRAQAAQAKALLLPSLGLGATKSTGNQESSNIAAQTAVFFGDGKRESSGIGARLNVPILNVQNWKTYAQAQAQLSGAPIQARDAEQNLIFRTAQVYFDVLVAENSLQLAQAQKKAVTEQLNFAKRNFEIGTATITDSREAQARFDLVSAQEGAAEFDLEAKRSALAQLVGREGAHAWPIANPFRVPPTECEALEQCLDKVANSGTVRGARIAYKVAQLETEKARAGHYPTLDLAWDKQKGESSPNPSAPLFTGGVKRTTDNTTLNLNIPLFAGFAVSNQIQEKALREEKARNDLLAAERGVAQGVRLAFFAVQSLTAQVKALEAARLSTQSALDANKLGYEVGVRINIDVLNAQSQLFQTERDLATARYELLLAQLRIKMVLGILRPADIEAITPSLKAVTG